MKQKQTAPEKNILIVKSKNFFHRDDIPRATSGKREPVTYKKNKNAKTISTGHDEKPLWFI